MSREHSAIRKYLSRLPQALAERYGSGPYSAAQVDIAVGELRLSDRYVHYAYALYCHEDVLEHYGLAGEKLQDIFNSVAAASGGGITALALEHGLFGSVPAGDGVVDIFGGGSGGGEGGVL